MDELCNSFKKQKVFCPDENTEELVQAFQTCRNYLQNGVNSEYSMIFLLKCRKRYSYYNEQNWKFGNAFKFIENAMQKFLNTEIIIQNEQILLLLAYFIDVELGNIVGFNVLLDESE